LEENIASIFNVEHSAKQETNMKQAAMLLYSSLLLDLHINPKSNVMSSSKISVDIQQL
jgi:hypothetical protein